MERHSDEASLVSRFFTDNLTDGGTVAVITGDDVKHIRKVLRLEPGDSVDICDGHGTEYSGVIRSVEADAVTVSLGAPSASPAEPEHAVTLFQGYPKAGKLETVIQKCTEIGVSSVVPVVMKRSVAIPSGDGTQKLVRLQRVAEEAAKQSRRGLIPAVGTPVRLTAIDLDAFDLIIVAYELERDVTLKQVLRSRPDAKRIALFVGPEGGFEPDEVELLKAHGAVAVTLGKRILRTETAGPVMLAQVLYEFE